MASEIKFLARIDAITRMNELASADIPFVFVIDYDGRHSIVMPEAELDESVMQFCFSGHGNVSPHYHEYHGEVQWNIYPPSTEEYKQRFDVVKNNLLAGNSYLVNLTCRIPVITNLSLHDIFCHSDARYKLWLKNQFVCFSPEIFIRIDGRHITTYPMKGTAPDCHGAADRLLADDKEAAEHATIVDLMRNDLSRIARDVSVSRYRYVDRIITSNGTILQTSSEIEGYLVNDWKRNIGTMLFQMLPAGSITGAPKTRTMKIIEEVEGYHRGFYTGVMGRYADGCLDSAVMIRFIDYHNGTLYFKAGGGITARSIWEKEYDEMIQKVYVPIH